MLEALAQGTGAETRRSATTGEELLYGAIVVRQQGRVAAVVRVAYSLRGSTSRCASCGAAWGSRCSWPSASPSSCPPWSRARSSARCATSWRPRRRLADGDLTARIQIARADELGELATILNQAADQLQARLGRAGPRPGAHRGHPVGDGRRRPRDRSPRPGRPGERASCCATSSFDSPVGRHYLEVVRHHQVGELVDAVLRTANGAWPRSRCRTANEPSSSPACPSRGPRGRRRAPCSRSTTRQNGGAWTACGATSSPTPRTSCARR